MADESGGKPPATAEARASGKLLVEDIGGAALPEQEQEESNDVPDAIPIPLSESRILPVKSSYLSELS
jgi:hypothetical protein